MQRLTLVVLVGCLLLAGCVSAPSPTATGAAGDTPTPTPTSTDPASSPTHTGETPPPTTGLTTTAPPVGGSVTPPQENVTVEYLVRPGSIPEAFGSVTVHFEVAFAETEGEVPECTGTVLDSRYDPTPTPLPTPSGECRTFDAGTVDLTDVNGTHSLGNFTVPGRFGAEHALVVRDVVPRFENGTRVERIHDTDVRGPYGRGSGRKGLEIGVVEADDDVSWTYQVDYRLFDPDE